MSPTANAGNSRTDGFSGFRGLVVAASLICLLLCSVARAQEGPTNAPVNPPKVTAPRAVQSHDDGAAKNPAVADDGQTRGRSLITDREQLLSFSILVFGLCVLIVQYLLLRTPKRNTFEILQLLTINLIVTGTLFLICAGFEAQQIAPGLGLFGTVAGYVLGRRSTATSKESNPSEP
jgi:hypothetical protein